MTGYIDIDIDINVLHMAPNYLEILSRAVAVILEMDRKFSA